MPTPQDLDVTRGETSHNDLPTLPERLAVREAIAISLLALGAMTTLSLMSYWPQDVSLNAAAGVPGAPTHNWIGPVGALWADLCLQGLGLVAWVFAGIFLVVGTRTLLRRSISPKPAHVLCFVMLTVTLGTLVELLLVGHRNPYPMGGLFGALCARGLRQQFNPVGAAVLAASGALMSLTVCFGGVMSGLAARVATRITSAAVRGGRWGRDGERLAEQLAHEEQGVLSALDAAWTQEAAHPEPAMVHALDPILVQGVVDPAPQTSASTSTERHAAWAQAPMGQTQPDIGPTDAWEEATSTAAPTGAHGPDDGPAIAHDEAAMRMAMACLSRDEAAGQGPAVDVADADVAATEPEAHAPPSAESWDVSAMAHGPSDAEDADAMPWPGDGVDEALTDHVAAHADVAAEDAASAARLDADTLHSTPDPDAQSAGEHAASYVEDPNPFAQVAEAAAPSDEAMTDAPPADLEAHNAAADAASQVAPEAAGAQADGAARALEALMEVMHYEPAQAAQDAAEAPVPDAFSMAQTSDVPPAPGPPAPAALSPAATAVPHAWPTMAASDPAPYTLPPADLLDFTPIVRSPVDTAVLQDNALKLTRTLKEYGIDGHVREIRPGPVVTMYEYVPGPGIKLSRIASLADDLAMSMEALRVRIVAPIPGKGAVGIEIPNEVREMVFFKEIITHEHFTEPQSPLTMALGKDIEGCPAVADLARMPHLLVAGATGAGKSVSINAMIMSVLYKATPSQVRIIMVDPKMLELSVYEGIPHLLLPVVTDAKKAALALRWAVEEMERRYELLSEVGVRNIDGYNARVQAGVERGEPVTVAGADEDGLRKTCEPLPYLLVIVDELADLMMVASRDVETSIMRLAQMARAAGIHLVLATQRPSVDVLTGVIKANFPTRIAFQVASRHDSRTIIDAQGAEHLLGRGDMLYMSSAAGGMARIHGAYVSEEDIERTVNFVRGQGAPEYDESILTQRADDSELDTELESLHDEMYDQAVAVVAESQQASISMIQRRLRIGYNRAARMVERMEIEGIVGPADGAKPREVIVSHQG